MSNQRDRHFHPVDGVIEPYMIWERGYEILLWVLTKERCIVAKYLEYQNALQFEWEMGVVVID